MSGGAVCRRRDLLAAGVAAGGTALAAGVGPMPLGTRSASAATDDDPTAILEAAIALEQQAEFAYTSAAESGELSQGTRRAALRFAGQEKEHAEVLIAALEDLGGEPPERPDRPEAVPGLAAALRRGQAGFIRFAIRFETAAVRGYYDATAELKDPRLLSAGASIMASEAQHLVVMRQALGRAPSPSAFVTGRP